LFLQIKYNCTTLKYTVNKYNYTQAIIKCVLRDIIYIFAKTNYTLTPMAEDRLKPTTIIKETVIGLLRKELIGAKRISLMAEAQFGTDELHLDLGIEIVKLLELETDHENEGEEVMNWFSRLLDDYVEKVKFAEDDNTRMLALLFYTKLIEEGVKFR